MTIEEQIEALRAQNGELRARLGVGKSGPKPGGFLALVKDKPGFKAYCQSAFRKPPTLRERLERSRKGTAAKMRSAMRPKGVWSLLKSGPYTTGRYFKAIDEEHKKLGWVDGKYQETDEPMEHGPWAETAKLVRVSKDEWTSELEEPLFAGEGVKYVEVPQWHEFPPYLRPLGLETLQNAPDSGLAGPTLDEQELGQVIEAIEAQNALYRAILERRAA